MNFGVHFCLLDRECREFADPLNLYNNRLQAIASLARVTWRWRGWFHVLALTPQAKFQQYDKTTQRWTQRWVYHTSHPDSG